MPLCPNDATEMVSTETRKDASRSQLAIKSARCCPECGYAE